MIAPRLLSAVLLAAAALVPPAARAGDFRVPLRTEGPVVDGRIEPDEWRAAAGFEGLAWNGRLDRRRARAWVAATTAHLYVALQTQLPDEGDLLIAAARDSLKVVYDDSFEVWLDPTPGSEHGRVYQLLANAAGRRAYQVHPRGREAADPAWTGTWKVAQARRAGWWSVELAIPLAEVAPGRTADQGAWGINVCRNWKEPWSFSSTGGGAYAPTDRFTFAAGAPAVHVTHRGDPFTGGGSIRVEAHNPGPAPVGMAAHVSLASDRMPEAARQDAVPIGAGGTRVTEVAVAGGTSRAFDLRVRVTDAAGATVYDRAVGWQAGAPGWKWRAVKAVTPPVDFQFAYYPYADRMRVRADLSGLPPAARVRSAALTVRRAGGGKPVRTVPLKDLKEGRQTVAFSLPPLSGRYEIALRAEGPGVPRGEVVKPFERTRYAWERSRAGRSTRVYPPFTPIEVRGARVSTVLREHDMTGQGLWRQVTAAGRPLLARTMRFTGPGGRPTGGGALRFLQAAGHRAVAAGAVRGLGAEARVRSTWDIDGAMRVDLTLGPGRVEALTLEVPLLADSAQLIHAMGDGIRNTIYARVPQGRGVVWTAARVQASDLPQGFCSYLYVGSPKRGICWFAENDRGWSLAAGQPNLDLSREGGAVVLRVRLVSRPVTLKAPRTLTFGLQAAPVKPRLAPWRHRWARESYSLLGTDINWLALGDCGSVYPAGKDLELWRAIRRGNAERLDDAEVERIRLRGRRHFEPYGQEALASWDAHVRHNLRSRTGTRMVFYYNRSSYQAADEFQTFQDEWCLTDWRTVGPGRSRGEVPLVPTESYIDHALYWYGRSFEVGGNRGVYWDNWFFNASYNTHGTGAYHRPDGSVSPSTGIWGLRELARRTFQYMNERKMLPVTMAHMTSTGILPLLSFCTVQYDWEWKYGEGDFHYRFPREYILAVSSGELAGTWPVLLGDHGALESDPWTQRTFAGVCLVHEMTPSGRLDSVWDPLLKAVYGLIDRPGARAYRYWDDGPQPVTTGDPDLPGIVYAVPGEALYIVTSYAEESRAAAVRVDAAALGLAPGWRALDAETGKAVPVEDGRLRLDVPRHGLRLVRLLAP